MKKIILSFVLLILANTCDAQAVSGYLGKRLIVGYSMYFMPGFKGPGVFSASPTHEMSPTINNVHCLNIEFAHKQNKMLCLSGQYMLTGVAYDNGKSNDGFFNLFRESSEFPYPEGHRYEGNFSSRLHFVVLIFRLV